MIEWKAITLDFFKDKYLVSNKGEVKTVNGLILNQTFDSKGYLKVHLFKEGKRKTVKVHRLVASAFIDNPQNKLQVNHIDGDRTNNNADNLEWVTCKENIEHAYINNLAKTGKEHHSSKHIVLKKKNGDIISQYSNLQTLSNLINIDSCKLIKTLKNNNVNFELIDKIDNKLPLDLKLNPFKERTRYCPIAIYNENMKLIAMYTNISIMNRLSAFPEYIGNKSNLKEPIKYKKRGKQYKNYYYIKKISFEDFFFSQCDVIDNYFEVK